MNQCMIFYYLKEYQERYPDQFRDVTPEILETFIRQKQETDTKSCARKYKKILEKRESK